MSENSYPQLRRQWLKFRNNAILTAGMLQELHDFPREILRLKYLDYSPGIICGLEFRKQGENILLTPGVVRLGQELFTLAEPVPLSAVFNSFRREHRGTSGLLNFIISRGETQIFDGVPSARLDIMISDTPADNINSLQIAAFFGDLPLSLPDPDSPADFPASSTTTMNILDTPSSRPGESTFHPLVFAAFSRVLSQKNPRGAFDCALLTAINENSVLSMATLRCYVESCGIDWPVSRADRFNAILESLRMPPPRIEVASVAREEPAPAPRKDETSIFF